MIGFGVLNGMAVTLRNFIGSYFEKDRLTTVQYPEERDTLPENYRNFPFLIFDSDDAQAGPLVDDFLDARIPGCCDDRVNRRVERQSPDDGVLTSTGANDENLHEW